MHILRLVTGIIICSGIFLGLYRLLLSGKVNPSFARAYILISSVLAIVIPVMRIPVWPGRVISVDRFPVMFDYLPPVVEEAVPVAAGNPAPVSDFFFFGLLLYCLVAVFFIVRSMRGLKALSVTRGHGRKLCTQNIPSRLNDISIVESDSVKTPYSFWRTIYVQPGLSEEEYGQVISHERSHIRRLHSLDLVLLTAMRSVFWFNPFWRFVIRDLKEVHEFQADMDVLRTGADAEKYRLMIVRQLLGDYPVLANGLRGSMIKKRLIMMNNTENKNGGMLRKLAVIPVLAVLLTIFTFTGRADTVLYNDVPESVPLMSINAVEVTPELPLAVTAEEQQMIPALQEVPIVGNDNPELFGLGRVSMDSIWRRAYRDSATGHVSWERVDSVSEVWLRERGLSLSYLDSLKRAHISRTDSLRNQNFRLIDSLSRRYNMKRETVRSTTLPDSISLYLLDGIPVDRTAVHSLDLSTVDQVTVLKGETAVKLYGPEASDGIVIITTQAGRQGSPVTITGSVTIPQRNRRISGHVGPIGIAGTHSTTPGTAWEMVDLNGILNGANDNFFTIAETMPKFQGKGIEKYEKWVRKELSKELIFKDPARITVQFVIMPDGTVSHIQPLLSSEAWLSRKVVSIMANSPKWTPGKTGGQNVPVRMVLSMEFNM